MKKHLTITVLIGIFLICFSCASDSNVSEYDGDENGTDISKPVRDEGLRKSPSADDTKSLKYLDNHIAFQAVSQGLKKHDIAEYRETDMIIEYEDGKRIEIPGSFRVINFTENGKPLKMEAYDTESNLVKRIEYGYSEDGDLSSKKVYFEGELRYSLDIDNSAAKVQISVANEKHESSYQINELRNEQGVSTNLELNGDDAAYSISRIPFFYYEKDGSLSEIAEVYNDKWYEYERVLKFSSNDFLKSEAVYEMSSSSGGAMQYKYVYATESNRSVFRTKVYDSDGGLLRKIVSRYDDEGRLLEKSAFNPDKLVYKLAMEYNATGSLTSKVEYNQRGPVSETKMEYNEEGKLIEQSELKDGVVTLRYVLTYDENGKLFQKSLYSSDSDDDFFTKYEYTYDSKGMLNGVVEMHKHRYLLTKRITRYDYKYF